MENLVIFINTFGWQIALIAFIGIVLLGVLKYANVFSSIEKEKRKPIYFFITVGFSIVATVIYLLIIGKFSIEYIVTVATAIYALNQTMYAVYETTKLRDLIASILTILTNKLKK